jgi:hypothetical protein
MRLAFLQRDQRIVSEWRAALKNHLKPSKQK